ncbi:MAG TPA: HTTM domain-containing protein [Nannocystaceae bacterium]|nr:HTTM domain-containing protein [Nannocystaceae bacterium]
MATDRLTLPRAVAAVFAPVDIASLAVLRIAIGVLMLVATLRFWAHGWIDELLLAPTVHLPYWLPGVGSLWIEPLPAPAMYGLFAAMAVCALLVALGWGYRIAIVGLLFGFVYVELVDATNYLNHYYAITLVLAFMAMTPLHGSWSIDALRRPRLRRAHVPAWMPAAVRLQLAIVYGFAGLAKLHADWLQGTVLHMWLRTRVDTPVVGALLADPGAAQAMAIAGAVFDLAIVPALLWSRTRAFAWIAVVLFHAITGLLFPIGMFPWIMIALSTVFFAPDWPRRWIRGGVAAPPRPVGARARHWVVAALAVHFTIQLVLPLRSLAYPGDVRWHEQGMRWSWRVMLIEKTGIVDFVVTEPATGRTWRVDPAEELTPRQAKMMATQPDLVLAYAHLVRDRFRARGLDVEVRAESFAALNGRPSRRFLDRRIDLAAVPDDLAPYEFVLPFTTSADR